MEHPAHRIAGMAADGAEELRGYLAPAAGLPWELTEDDHRDLMPRLCDAVARLAECIDSIAQVTTAEDAKGQLIEDARTILRGCRQVQAGTVHPCEQRSPGPGAATRPQPPQQWPDLPARQHRRCRAARLPRLPNPPAARGADTAEGFRSETFPRLTIN